MTEQEFYMTCEPDKLFSFIHELRPIITDRKWWFIYTNGVVMSRLAGLYTQVDLRKIQQERQTITHCLYEGYDLADNWVSTPTLDRWQPRIPGCEDPVDYGRWITDMKREDLFVGVAPILCDVIRDVVDPFNYPKFEKTDSLLRPVWVTDDVLAMAEKIRKYSHVDTGELDCDAMMVLSDALEEAGCDHPGILKHLRGCLECYSCMGTGRILTYSRGLGADACCSCAGTGTGGPLLHRRGCWAIEFLTGKD